jgi:hypothetical protein
VNENIIIITGLPLNSSCKIKSPVTARAFKKSKKEN